MRSCEGYNYSPRVAIPVNRDYDSLQTIDHGRQLGYNSIDRKAPSMLPSPDSMTQQKHDTSRKPHPSAADPLEVRIRGLIREQAYAKPEGMKMWADARQVQKDYFIDAIAHANEPSYVHNATQETLRKVADVMHAQVVSGKENIGKLNTPALVALNHYSGYKLTSFKPEDLSADFGNMPELYPFPSFFASMVPVAEEMGDNVTLYDAHLEYAPAEANLPLRKVQEGAGLLVIPEQSDGFASTVAATKKIVTEHPNSLLVVFPEGESSGKRNNGSPYDMVPFHTGTFVIAGELGLPILPAVQFFNPETGFQVAVLPPIQPRIFEKGPDGKATQESKDYYEQLALDTHDKMQKELDRLAGRAA